MKTVVLYSFQIYLQESVYMLFDLTHCLYIGISLVITAGLLWAFSFIKEQKYKDLVLKLSGVITVILHISCMWVDFLTTGTSITPDNILFPIYFCNLMMWLLVICAFIPNKQSKGWKWVAIFTAYGGTLGALISLFYPDYYLHTPSLANWGVLKSMLSHSTMLVGCLYMFTGGYVKIRVSNLIPYCGGLVGVLVIGHVLNALFVACGLPSPNAMFLQHSPVPDVPFFNGYGIGLLMIILLFLFTMVWEFAACPKGERWYDKLAEMFKRLKERTSGREQ